jgi:hypothetical protein
MAETNGANQRKPGANENVAEDMGPHLSQVKTSGGMTISPELFEKVDDV